MSDKLELMFQIGEKAFLIEQERAKNLTDKAEKYISAIAVIIGFQLVSITDLHLIGFNFIHNWLAIIGLILLGIAFMDAFSSNRVRDYVSYPDSKMIKTIFTDEEMDVDSAKAGFTMSYLNALDVNLLINDERAKLLKKSGNFIAIGFGFIVARYILEMLIK